MLSKQWQAFQFTLCLVLGHQRCRYMSPEALAECALLEFDGYYVLMDLLEVPNLRAKALAFLGARLWRRARTTRDPGLARVFTVYGVLTLLYTAVVAGAVLTGYQGVVRGGVGRVLPDPAAGLLGWGLAGAMAGLILGRAWGDLRQGLRQDRTGADPSKPRHGLPDICLP